MNDDRRDQKNKIPINLTGTENLREILKDTLWQEYRGGAKPLAKRGERNVGILSGRSQRKVTSGTFQYLPKIIVSICQCFKTFFYVADGVEK